MAAALELFAERGFYGTAVPLIAERARVGAGTVYRYFASKEAIVNALYRHHKERFAAGLLGLLEPAQPAREQLHILWTALLRFVRENPSAFKFLELHHHGPYLDETSLAIEAQLAALGTSAFEEFRRAKVVKDVSGEIMMAIVQGAFVGLIKAADEGRIELSDAVAELTETCIWEAIRA